MIQARILLKTDLIENWENSTFSPLLGEFCVYLNNQNAVAGIKIGNGTQKANLLPFIRDEYITANQINSLFQKDSTLDNFVLDSSILS